MAKKPATIQLKVTLEGSGKLAENMDKWGLATKTVAKRIVSYYSYKIMRGAVERVVVDRGRLRAAIKPHFYQQGLTADIVAGVKYAPFIEFGTGPRGKQMTFDSGPLPAGYVHGNGGKMPPVQLIKEWISRKGINPPPGMTLDGFAFVVARRIGERGLPARPFLYPAFRDVEDAFNRRVKKFLKEVKDERGVA